MATAAFEFYAGSFAQHFGIPHVIGTKWDGQRIEGDNCYGTEKHRRVIAWLERHGLSPNDLHIRFVSDYPMTVTGKMQKFLMRESMERELGVKVAETA